MQRQRRGGPETVWWSLGEVTVFCVISLNVIHLKDDVAWLTLSPFHRREN